jgi:hypothetical protein
MSKFVESTKGNAVEKSTLGIIVRLGFLVDYGITGHATLSGWQVNLRTYREFPGSAPLFRYVEKGNVKGIKQLLAMRQAFITDRIGWNGATVLHVSIGNCCNAGYFGTWFWTFPMD